ncbi:MULTISPECIES: ABC transporter permease [Enterococcus]|uniref:ABC transporter permease n=1 Tax=Enterococcus mundtii TaxID=53346 RepID=A0A2M9FTN9_ENTMU|nr:MULTISPECIES: ABC transporter permease [Enterococcus]MBE6171483.1 ABC transporter permease [Enterococcus faecium]AZP93333.1 ABC transporter permease [Enterococcus mundtii]EOH63740.1 ABC transporter membrane-spanning permease [Enterococcus mundtii ATCC 882]EOU13279.1 ABC transporter membrane-spanning permease [Enterococcus mundtii ATCC 882]EYT96723.1 sodium ABC transporter permease [Enterococcus mundtii CRL35]
MGKFWIITKDVYLKNVKSISFIIMILVPFVLMGVIYLAGNFAQQNSETDKIGVIAEDQQITDYLSQSDMGDFHFEAFSSEDEAKSKLSDEKIDAYMVVTTDNGEVSGELFSENSLGQATQLLIQQQLTGLQSMMRASSLGISPEEVAALSQPAGFSRQKVSFDANGEMTIGEDNSAVQYAVSYVATIILFIIILTYAQIIAQEIASEKGTRIMEVILSSTTAQKHFYGKLTGVLLVAVTQMALYGIIFAVGFNQFKDMEIVKSVLDGISLDSIFGPFLWYSLLFMFFGILIYAVLAALCGSLVNKAEDTAKAILPVTYLSLGGYMLGLILGASDPNNIVIRITSYIPFLSSYIMPIRLANETVEISGVLISLIVLVIITFVLMFMSANMYKSNVLVYSEGGIWTSLKQSISIMRNERKKK